MVSQTTAGGYTAIPSTDTDLGVGSSRHTSASSSLTSSPRHSSNLYPAGDDEPYELSEKWSGKFAGQTPYAMEQEGPRRRDNLLTEGVMTVLHKGKTTILLCVCFLLALMVLIRDDRASTPKSTSNAAVSVAPIASAPKPYRLEDDMVLITKVGSATVHKRLLIHLAEQPLSNLYMPNHLYVSDYSLTLSNITFYDALANVSSTVAALDEFKSLRAELKALVESNQDLDDMSQKDGGWKLDKYKFLPAVAEAYRRWPGKKWYVMVEADTFLFWNQLVKWLGELDEKKQLMMGHPSFCDYDEQSTMFTHGGSGIVLSGATVEASFGQDADFEHTHDDLIQKSAFGDALLSKSIYDSPLINFTELSPEGGERFNSDPPRVLKFTRGNWCSPIMSFHHITPSDAAHLYDFQRRIEPKLSSTDVVRWSDIWDEFIPAFLKEAMQQVGRWDGDSVLKMDSVEPGEVGVIGWQAIEDWDSETKDFGTRDAAECQRMCRGEKDCLMWEWRKGDGEFGKCRYTSDFLRIGVTKPKADDGLTTGWMGMRIDRWRKEAECSGRTGLNLY
ncbi:hypothetical protein PHBOTO_003915 [Pseudozyma hubeiensis]|nr:hypothetical protein PHBOTO_003915 [Pseudozyma hubeiensis]